MSLSQRLQKIVKRDTGIDIDLPESINRGHWREDGTVRWRANGTDGQRYEGEDSMSDCIKHGVCHPRDSVYKHWGIKYIDRQG